MIFLIQLHQSTKRGGNKGVHIPCVLGFMQGGTDTGKIRVVSLPSLSFDFLDTLQNYFYLFH